MIASKNAGKAAVVVKPHIATAHQKAAEILSEHRAASFSKGPVKINANLRGANFMQGGGAGKAVESFIDWETIKNAAHTPLSTAKGFGKIALLTMGPAQAAAVLGQKDAISAMTMQDSDVNKASAVTGILPMGTLERLSARGTSTALHAFEPSVRHFIVDELGHAAHADNEHINEKVLNEALGTVERPSVPGEITNPTVVAKDIKMEKARVQSVYDDVSKLFDPNHPFSYDDFLKKYPHGKITLSRLDAENLIENKQVGFFEPAGAYSGPKSKVAGKGSLHDEVTIEVLPRTESQQKNALLTHGQAGNKRQKVINSALDNFYKHTGIVDPRKAIRQAQIDSFTPSELERIWGKNGNYKIVEPAASGHATGWSRVDHGDHLIARKRIENRVVDLANSKPVKSEQQKVAKIIEAYVEFQNSADNFMGLHGIGNIKKSDKESYAWLEEVANTPYEELPPKLKPYKIEVDRAYTTLKNKIGEEEFNIFMSKY